jgi:hypothetical protein
VAQARTRESENEREREKSERESERNFGETSGDFERDNFKRPLTFSILYLFSIQSDG